MALRLIECREEKPKRQGKAFGVFYFYFCGVLFSSSSFSPCESLLVKLYQIIRKDREGDVKLGNALLMETFEFDASQALVLLELKNNIGVKSLK